MSATADRRWGSKAHAYYGQEEDAENNAEASDAELHVEEAKLLQKAQKERLNAAHCKLFGEDSDDEEEGAAEEKRADAAGGAVQEVELERDVASLTKEERLALLRKEHPELLPLVKDFKASLEALAALAALEGKLALLSEDGRKYVELQAELRLRYATHLSFYFAARCSGDFQKGHPVVEELLRLRKLVQRFGALSPVVEAEMRKVAQMEVRKAEESEEEDEGQEVAKTGNSSAPVRRAPERLRLSDKIQRLARAASASNSLLRTTTSPSASASAGGAREKAAFAPLRAEQSVKDMFRLPKRAQEKRQACEDPSLLPFAPNRRQRAAIATETQRMLTESKKRGPQSGDGHVDFKARKKVADVRFDDAADTPKEAEEANAPQLSAKKRRALKRREERARSLPAPVQEVEGKRKSAQYIVKNRGLMRQRLKTAGNARVSNRRKYEKALTRRKGAVVEMRVASADGATYHGEATGIRSTVKKSKKLS